MNAPGGLGRASSGDGAFMPTMPFIPIGSAARRIREEDDHMRSTLMTTASVAAIALAGPAFAQTATPSFTDTSAAYQGAAAQGDATNGSFNDGSSTDSSTTTNTSTWT